MRSADAAAIIVRVQHFEQLGSRYAWLDFLEQQDSSSTYDLDAAIAALRQGSDFRALPLEHQAIVVQKAAAVGYGAPWWGGNRCRLLIGRDDGSWTIASDCPPAQTPSSDLSELEDFTDLFEEQVITSLRDG